MTADWPTVWDPGAFQNHVLAWFPQAEIGEDNDGQLVIYTGYKEVNGAVVLMEDD